MIYNSTFYSRVKKIAVSEPRGNKISLLNKKSLICTSVFLDVPCCLCPSDTNWPLSRKHSITTWV